MMYIWVAIDVNKQLMELREQAENYAREQDLVSSTLTLPFHISLKISFYVPDERSEEAVNEIRDFYYSLKPFQIRVKGIEQMGPIVWITMRNNAQLSDIHQKLDELLFRKFSIPQHEFDKDFTFHTSIFMVNDYEQITKAFEKIKDTAIPGVLTAEEFIIGSSAEGIPGTYKVIERIKI